MQTLKSSPRRNWIILGAIGLVAVIVAIAFVALSSQSSFSELKVDYAQIPQGRQDDGGFVLGDPAAPITVVAFEDFLCPSCQRYKATTEQFIEQYVAPGLARFEYRILPVVDPGYSPLAGALAECADALRPGSFWEAHDRLFEIASARRFSDSSSRSFAEMMDLPYTDLLECAQDATQADVDARLATQMNVRGTPTVMIRYGAGPLMQSPVGTQPTIEQLGILVAQAG